MRLSSNVPQLFVRYCPCFTATLKVLWASFLLQKKFFSNRPEIPGFGTVAPIVAFASYRALRRHTLMANAIPGLMLCISASERGGRRHKLESRRVFTFLKERSLLLLLMDS